MVVDFSKVDLRQRPVLMLLDKAADVAIGKINEAFGKNGVVNNKVSRLRQ